MIVSVLVSAETMESAIAHAGIPLSARKYVRSDRSFEAKRKPKIVMPIRYTATINKSIGLRAISDNPITNLCAGGSIS